MKTLQFLRTEGSFYQTDKLKQLLYLKQTVVDAAVTPAWSTFGLSDSLVQKAATWLLIGPEKRRHITSVLAQLHWLAVESGFIYILFFGSAQLYVADRVTPHFAASSLESSSAVSLSAPPLT